MAAASSIMLKGHFSRVKAGEKDYVVFLTNLQPFGYPLSKWGAVPHDVILGT
jgi:hypothetical protein